MPETREGRLRVLDCRADEHVYLHPDFHGALCHAVHHLDERHGPAATERFLRQVARTVFRPLSDRLRSEGLSALETHWRALFAKEGGEVALSYAEDGALELRVSSCPAVSHLKSRGLFFTPRFCETTRVVNDELCRAAGYRATCEYEPGAGRCVQRFRKMEEGA